jgi:hypothetical protein
MVEQRQKYLNSSAPSEKVKRQQKTLTQSLKKQLKAQSDSKFFAWAQGGQQDEEARNFALKAFKLSTSLKHLEAKNMGKKETFSMRFLEQYNEAKYQQSILRAATNNNPHESN